MAVTPDVTSMEIVVDAKVPGNYSIMLIEDSASLAHVYSEYFRLQPVDLIHFDNGHDAINYLRSNIPDAILLDLKLPDLDGMDILRHVIEKQLPSPVVIITGHGSVEIAVEAMNLGAADFLVKPFDRERLIITLRNVLKINRLTEIVDDLQQFQRDGFAGFIGDSVSMQIVYKTIDAAAASSAPFFITGESGTGKEVCAAAVHSRSPRKDNPFIAINCAAIPITLLESELFGHTKGAFTGAVSERKGAALQADTGTLFLDEIGDLPLNLQAKLLRFVQSGAIQKVGSDQVESVDVRIVCATNRDPKTLVASGLFREDLFYRLHVIPIKLPSLRERDDDVVLLAAHFLNHYCSEESKSFTKFSMSAIDKIRTHSWPGNVRELQNVIRNVVVMNEGIEVSDDMLPEAVGAQEAVGPLGNTVVQNHQPNYAPDEIAFDGPKDITPLWLVEKKAILEAIAYCGNSVPRAAAYLEVSPSTIYRKLQSWGDVDV
ncbi:MAG: two-component system repressor protein LuxO [Gammaproteobacteria bacterium]|jgi:two-component system repressor protein LuxO